MKEEILNGISLTYQRKKRNSEEWMKSVRVLGLCQPDGPIMREASDKRKLYQQKKREGEGNILWS